MKITFLGTTTLLFDDGTDQPSLDMPEMIERTEVVFFKLAKYCEAHDVNCLIQYPCTSMEI